jgi:serine phosphatase RsbU (regulator of sigma subunit)
MYTNGLVKLVVEAARLELPEMRKEILDAVCAWSCGQLSDDVSLVIIKVR